uniref:Thioredoxin, putative n=1 Tax=Riptortus pedestris TaxID=329032 RepID=R4WPK4_RIPPE|nr:thioredoxin, putative [Riptortus pedestris]
MFRAIRNVPFRHIQKFGFSTTNSCRESFKVQDLNDFNERVKNSKKPVIVDFFATWCNPCKALTPRIENVIAEKKGEVVLAKVDIDEHSELALDYDVGSVPVLIAIRNGKVEERLVGLQDTDKLRQFVDKFTNQK